MSMIKIGTKIMLVELSINQDDQSCGLLACNSYIIPIINVSDKNVSDSSKVADLCLLFSRGQASPSKHI